jgi:uncharacterized protein (DUF2235 family)
VPNFRDEPQTNVTRISRCIKNTARDGTHQIVYYHPGIGSSGSSIEYITGGDFGIGLDAVSTVALDLVIGGSNVSDMF